MHDYMHMDIKFGWNKDIREEVSLELKNARQKGHKARLNRLDLKGADLSYMDLSHSDLSSADLDGVDFSFSNLNCSNLAGASIRNSNLNYACLSNVYAPKVSFELSSLKHADLHHAELSAASLYKANLSNADLSCAYLPYSKLEYANLYQTNLYSTDLHGADLRNVKNFAYAILRNTKLEHAEFKHGFFVKLVAWLPDLVEPIAAYLVKEGEEIIECLNIGWYEHMTLEEFDAFWKTLKSQLSFKYRNNADAIERIMSYMAKIRDEFKQEKYKYLATKNKHGERNDATTG